MSLINVNNEIVFDASEYRLFKTNEDHKKVKIVDRPAVKKWLIFTVVPETSHLDEFTEYSIVGVLKKPKIVSKHTHDNLVPNPAYVQHQPVYQDLKVDEETILETREKSLVDQIMNQINQLTANST